MLLLSFPFKGRKLRYIYTNLRFRLVPEVVNPTYFRHATGGKVGAGPERNFRESNASGGSRKWGILCRSGKGKRYVQDTDSICCDPILEMNSLRLREAK